MLTPEKHLENLQKNEKKKSRASFYQSVWRWHFYAGLFASPFLIILAFSGAVYLFKPQIEASLYQDQYFSEDIEGRRLSLQTQVETAREQFPEGIVTYVRTFDDATRTTEIGVLQQGTMLSAYISPYTGEFQGSIKNQEKFTEIFKKLHSELIIGGTFANRLVELAACWTVILLITGLYLWFPRSRASIWGTILPRLHKKGRIFWRDMHAVPAFWLSIGILLLILTGLPWSGVTGENIKWLSDATNTGFPKYAHSFGEKPQSAVTSGEAAEDIPWAVENMPVPSSSAPAYVALDINDIDHIAATKGIAKPYTISYPQGDTGVYTIATSHSKPGDNATLHIDQYSGAVLSDVRFADFGLLGKAITLGIALHEGRLFGLANQLLGLLVCIGIIGIVISSFLMWKKRKTKGALTAPPKPHNHRTSLVLFFTMLGLGVLMPLVGISIIIVFLVDTLLIKKIPRLKKYLH
ncbi:PepSY domain-containing protein [Bacillus lacus]|uniref:PepSY domain-containing protein n=1 Tax=Metabacillus lacus TaxID=1983721 RepID=A0A7X2IXZ4_9BACI|nr:PepSY domain-containing protein [Metabacillus lacus]MRX71881.1 PepSY domain-containing protein [Metabacillus lacus]